LTLFGPGDGVEPGGPDGAAPEGARRLRLTVAYHGAGFRGFAVQPGQRTVGGVLTQAIETVVGHPVRLTCAGRTDAGVHASGQVVHFDLVPERARAPLDAADPDLAVLIRRCNRLLGTEVAVTAAEVAGPGFDARRSARWRRYRYTVLNRATPDPLLADRTWHVTDELDLRGMQAACDPLFGEHDFAAFCRRPADDGSTVRRVLEAGWDRAGPDLLAFDIAASAFCHQMVRSIVGTIVDVGRGRLRAGDMAGILRSGDRAQARTIAPPHGLCLLDVGYA